MRHEAYCNGDLVAIIEKDKRGKWLIVWPRRGWCRERIANVEAAKTWINQIMHGKLVTYLRVGTKE